MSLPISSGSNLLSNASTTATNLGNLVLVTPSQVKGYQPQNPPDSYGNPSQLAPPPAFIFDFEGEQTAEVTSDITDHYIENNSSIQDQIALKPVKITTKGFVSELNDVPPFFLQIAKTIANKLTTVDAYSPGISTTALLAYNQAFQAYQIATNLVNSAVSAWATVAGGGVSVITGQADFPIQLQLNQNKQQTAFQTFYGYWANRTLFTIQTPWAIFEDMAIERLHPVQSEDTKTFTTFECTFKQIRTAMTSNSSQQSTVSQLRRQNQDSSKVSQGVSTPPSDIGLSSGLSNPTFGGLV